ncbi:hypothetical protein STEG23_001147 [Scotinomys teguina]
MTVTPLGWDQDCSLKIREPEVPAPWFLDPGGWSKTATVSLYFIFPGICTLSLDDQYPAAVSSSPLEVLHKTCYISLPNKCQNIPTATILGRNRSSETLLTYFNPHFPPLAGVLLASQFRFGKNHIDTCPH